MSLTEESKKYYKSVDRKHRNSKGQFFTEDNVKNLALKELKLPNGSMILENSCGSGEFIKSIIEINSNVQIDGYDIEQSLVDICNSVYPAANVKCQNFLNLNHLPIYDYVIGNPPYFEILKKGNENLIEKYQEVLCGRPNIYSLFFKASIDSLKKGGKLIYVVPTSMNNGSYFANLRKFIVDNCNIDEIINLGDSKFENVQQNTMIIKLTKLKDGEKNNGKYIFEKGNHTIFSTNYKELTSISSKGKTLKELGFSVKTGNLVWNQQKKFLSNNSSDSILIWACNIMDKKIQIPNNKLSQHKEKGQFVKDLSADFTITKIKEKSIVLNRITGSGSKAKIKAGIIDIPSGYYVENHVNYIVKKKNCEFTLEQLLSQLTDKSTIKFIQMLTGNTQISKTELEEIIPFNIEKK